MRKPIFDSDRVWEPKKYKIQRDEYKATVCSNCSKDCTNNPLEAFKCSFPQHICFYNDSDLATEWLSIYYKHFRSTAKYWLKHGKHKSACNPDIIFIQKMWDKFIQDFSVAGSRLAAPELSLPMEK
jgi:hypothetical protein